MITYSYVQPEGVWKGQSHRYNNKNIKIALANANLLQNIKKNHFCNSIYSAVRLNIFNFHLTFSYIAYKIYR